MNIGKLNEIEREIVTEELQTAIRRSATGKLSYRERINARRAAEFRILRHRASKHPTDARNAILSVDRQQIKVTGREQRRARLRTAHEAAEKNLTWIKPQGLRS